MPCVELQLDEIRALLTSVQFLPNGVVFADPTTHMEPAYRVV